MKSYLLESLDDKKIFSRGIITNGRIIILLSMNVKALPQIFFVQN